MARYVIDLDTRGDCRRCPFMIRNVEPFCAYWILTDATSELRQEILDEEIEDGFVKRVVRPDWCPLMPAFDPDEYLVRIIRYMLAHDRTAYNFYVVTDELEAMGIDWEE